MVCTTLPANVGPLGVVHCSAVYSAVPLWYGLWQKILRHVLSKRWKPGEGGWVAGRGGEGREGGWVWTFDGELVEQLVMS